MSGFRRYAVTPNGIPFLADATGEAHLSLPFDGGMSALVSQANAAADLAAALADMVAAYDRLMSCDGATESRETSDLIACMFNDDRRVTRDADGLPHVGSPINAARAALAKAGAS